MIEIVKDEPKDCNYGYRVDADLELIRINEVSTE